MTGKSVASKEKICFSKQVKPCFISFVTQYTVHRNEEYSLLKQSSYCDMNKTSRFELLQMSIISLEKKMAFYDGGQNQVHSQSLLYSKTLASLMQCHNSDE